MKREGLCSESIKNSETMKTEHTTSTGPCKHRARCEGAGHTRTAEAGPARMH